MERRGGDARGALSARVVGVGVLCGAGEEALYSLFKVFRDDVPHQDWLP